MARRMCRSPRSEKKAPPVIDRFISLAIRHFELRNGTAAVGNQRVPLDVRGDNLNATFDYDRTVPRYSATSRRGKFM